MKKSILVVDDSESIRSVVEFTLKSEGYDVILAADGSEGKKYLDNEKIDLILTDMNMPHVDGIEFIKIARAHPQHKTTPILFLTTESQTDKKMEAKKEGATGWIIKPFVPDKLMAAVKKLLR